MKEKLWSPGKPRTCWILWYEDQDGAGDKTVYLHKIEVEEQIKEILRNMVEDRLKSLDPGEEGEHDPERATLLGILEVLDKKPFEALYHWAVFAEDFSVDERLNAEESKLFGA